MREKIVEENLIKVVKSADGIAYKFTSPARRSVPDRLCLLPVAAEHQEIVGRYVKFVECKAPGKKPTPAQAREHDRLRKMGYDVRVLDSIEGAI